MFDNYCYPIGGSFDIRSGDYSDMINENTNYDTLLNLNNNMRR